MRKFLLIGLFLIIGACAHQNKEEQNVHYQCGNKHIVVEWSNRESMLLHMEGQNYMLVHAISVSGDKYENRPSHLVFLKRESGIFLEIADKRLPICQQVEE